MKNAHGLTCKKTKVYIYLYISLYENLFENGCIYIYIYIYIYISIRANLHWQTNLELSVKHLNQKLYAKNNGFTTSD